MQKTEVDQAKKTKFADAQQKLSEKEQEIKKMEEEVSLRQLGGVWLAFFIVENKGRTAEGKGRTDKERCRA